jgi:hypothetical protein
MTGGSPSDGTPSGGPLSLCFAATPALCGCRRSLGPRHRMAMRCTFKYSPHLNYARLLSLRAQSSPFFLKNSRMESSQLNIWAALSAGEPSKPLVRARTCHSTPQSHTHSSITSVWLFIHLPGQPGCWPIVYWRQSGRAVSPSPLHLIHPHAASSL